VLQKNSNAVVEVREPLQGRPGVRVRLDRVDANVLDADGAEAGPRKPFGSGVATGNIIFSVGCLAIGRRPLQFGSESRSSSVS
jgi:hypothetical protein